MRALLLAPLALLACTKPTAPVAATASPVVVVVDAGAPADDLGVWPVPAWG